MGLGVQSVREARFIKDRLSMTLCTGRASSNGQMAASTMATLTWARSMVKARTSGQMDRHTKVSSNLTNATDPGFSTTQMASAWNVLGRMERKMGQAPISGQTVRVTSFITSMAISRDRAPWARKAFLLSKSDRIMPLWARRARLVRLSSWDKNSE